jgi:hypothetical protein
MPYLAARSKGRKPNLQSSINPANPNSNTDENLLAILLLIESLPLIQCLPEYLMVGMLQGRSGVKHVIYFFIGTTCGVHAVELD